MNKSQNNNAGQFADCNIPCDIPFDCSNYQEVATFTSEDLQNLIDNGDECVDYSCDSSSAFTIDYNDSHDLNGTYNERAEFMRKHFIEITLKHPETNKYNIGNNLILDNCGKYACDINQFILDGVKFCPNLYIRGVFENIYSRNSNRVLRLTLCDLLREDLYQEEQGDTSYGFKLSQIIDDLGDLSLLTRESQESSVNKYADISFTQKVVVFTRCCRKHVIFSFKLKNLGDNVASKLLFKDVLPNNICIFKNGIFLNGKSIEKSNVNMEGRRIFVDLPDLDVNGEIDLIMVGLLEGDCETINVGCLCYKSGYTKVDGIKITNIVQILSNIKTLRLKGCM